MSTFAREIYEFIKQHPGSTAGQIIAGLPHRHAGSVRSHITALQTGGMLSFVGDRPRAFTVCAPFDGEALHSRQNERRAVHAAKQRKLLRAGRCQTAVLRLTATYTLDEIAAAVDALRRQ